MKLKLQLPLSALPGMTVTTMGDGLLIIRVPAENKQLKVGKFHRLHLKLI